jgi:hypothetical protein
MPRRPARSAPTGPQISKPNTACKVYAWHYDVPQRVKSVSRDYAGPGAALGPGGLASAKPIRHYVGWSQQADPRKRIYNHGPVALREIVYLESGTMVDELSSR